MRREGYEFCVSPPRVLTTEDEEGEKLEPIEEVGTRTLVPFCFLLLFLLCLVSLLFPALEVVGGIIFLFTSF